MTGAGDTPKGEELDAALVEFAEDLVGGDFLVHDEHVRVGAGDVFPVVAERDGFPVLGGFGDVGVGVDEVVGAGVLGEEGEHGAGALGAGGYVVAFQGGVLSPVHDGVEVQVEDGLLGGGQPGRDHGGVQAGEEGALVVVAGAVGVLGQGRLLRQGGQPGQQPTGGGNHAVAGVAGLFGQGGQVQGDQVGDGQQQPGHAGVHPRRPGGEVERGGPG